MNDIKSLNKAADNIRLLTAAMVEKAKSGHPGGAMGGADFINVLYSEFLIYDPENPNWEGRDRFFLDPGHMSPMLYSVLTFCGKYSLEDIKSFSSFFTNLHYKTLAVIFAFHSHASIRFRTNTTPQILRR